MPENFSRCLHLTYKVRSHRLVAISLTLLSAGVAVACSARRNKIAADKPQLAEKIQVPGVPDFGKVNDFLFRGAQPRDDGLQELHNLRIDTIVDLRGELQGVIEDERRQAESLGMRFINLPGSGWSVPKDKEIAKFFSLILERPRRVIFIHCWLGGDRSGTFIAAYRIAFEGWSPPKAIQEMRSFHYLHFWHPNMGRWVEKFPDRLAHSSELAPFRDLQNAPPQ